MNRFELYDEAVAFAVGVLRVCAILVVAFSMAVAFVYAIKALQ